jgi:hypothetical protein
MSDEIIHENLLLISESLDVINKRFSSINTPDDLVMDDYGVTILDSIAMRHNYPKLKYSWIGNVKDIFSILYLIYLTSRF